METVISKSRFQMIKIGLFKQKSNSQNYNKIMDNIKIVQLNGKQYVINLDKRVYQQLSGNLFYAFCKQTKEQFAVKIIPKQKGRTHSFTYNSIVTQAIMLKSLKHQNIVQIKQIIETGNFIYMFEQLCDQNLQKKTRKQFYPQNQCIKLLTQISKGYLYLLQQGLLHKGLTPSVIYFKGNVLKIRILDNLRNFRKYIKSQKHISKQSFYLPVQTAKYGFSSSKQDIWSIGMIFYQMLHNMLPFLENNDFEYYQKMETCQIYINRSKLSFNSIDFLEKTLMVKQTERIDWKEFFKHQIFGQQFSSKEGGSQIYQDKMKITMQRLKNIIETNNFSIKRILYTMGFLSGQEQIYHSQFTKFLRRIQPSISQSQAEYIFKKTDINSSNSLSINQIQRLFKQYGIRFSNSQVRQLTINKRESNPEDEDREKMQRQAQLEVRALFERLFKLVNGDLNQFQTVFYAYAEGEEIDFSSFRNLIGRLNERLAERADEGVESQQLEVVFKIIDENNSGKIDFLQFQNFFYRINGLPPRIRILPPTQLPKSKHY